PRVVFELDALIAGADDRLEAPGGRVFEGLGDAIPVPPHDGASRGIVFVRKALSRPIDDGEDASGLGVPLEAQHPAVGFDALDELTAGVVPIANDAAVRPILGEQAIGIVVFVSRDAAVRRLRAQLVTGSIVGELRHGPRGIAHAHDPPELVVRVRPRGSVGRDEARRVARGVPKETFGVAEGVRDLDDVAEIVVAILPLVPERVLRAREPPVLVTVLPRATLEIGAADRPVLVVVVDAHLAAVRRRRGRETTELVVLERALRDAVLERKHELAPLVVLVLRATANR